ncbi:MAG TPA: hypothetical protein VFC56_05015 [Stellaceae bacterium]|nr:hypothetical protein [Stellaceae bacterium]
MSARTYRPWLPIEDEVLAALLRKHGDGWRLHLAECPALAGRSLPTIGARRWQLRQRGDPRFSVGCQSDAEPPWPRRGEPWPEAGGFFAGHDSRRAALDLGSPRGLPPPEPFGRSALMPAISRYVR